MLIGAHSSTWTGQGQYAPSQANAVQGDNSSRFGSSAQPELSEEQQQLVAHLKSEDRRVRAHEQAHVNVGGSLILSGPRYDYETGPDGQRYAVSGDVTIDTSPAQTPLETLDKAHRIKATALAPADPSAQDRQVASMAAQMAIQAQAELSRERTEPASKATSNSQRDSDKPFSLMSMLTEAYQRHYGAQRPTLSVFA